MADPAPALTAPGYVVDVGAFRLAGHAFPSIRISVTSEGAVAADVLLDPAMARALARHIIEAAEIVEKASPVTGGGLQ